MGPGPKSSGWLDLRERSSLSGGIVFLHSGKSSGSENESGVGLLPETAERHVLRT